MCSQIPSTLRVRSPGPGRTTVTRNRITGCTLTRRPYEQQVWQLKSTRVDDTLASLLPGMRHREEDAPLDVDNARHDRSLNLSQPLVSLSSFFFFIIPTDVLCEHLAPLSELWSLIPQPDPRGPY